MSSAIAVGLPYYDPALWACPLCHYDSQVCICTEIEEPVKKSAKQQRREEAATVKAAIERIAALTAKQWRPAGLSEAIDEIREIAEMQMGRER